MPHRRLPRWNRPRPRARDLNALFEAIEANSSFGAGAGFYVHDSAIGRYVADVRERPILGVLTGTSGGGYTWDFAAATTGGGHTTYGNGLSIAYEANGKSNLPVGTVVELYPGDGAEKVFQWVGFACNWKFTVRGNCLNEALSGRLVTLKQSGATIATGTTNGSGVVTFDVPLGDYDVTVGAAGGYQAYSASAVAHTCAQSTTITLTASGLTIFPNACNSQPLAGTSVELKQGGVTIGTAITGVGGSVHFDVPSGTYTAVCTPPGGTDFQVTSSTFSYVCPGPTTIIFALGFDTANFVCRPCSKYPIPRLLYFTDANGEHELTFGLAGSGWSMPIGAYMIPARLCCADMGTGEIEVRPSLGCNVAGSPGGFSIQWSTAPCPFIGYQYVDTVSGCIGGGLGAIAFGTLVSWTENPFTATFSVPSLAADTAHGGNRPIGNTDPGWNTPGGGGTITVTG